MGAPVGNQNAKKAKIWEQALRRALARLGNSTTDAGLDVVASRLVNAAVDGEQWAILEIGNRLDGKPAQSLSIDGDGEGGPVQASLVVTFVKAGEVS